ncbi:VWA domain-containing protein [Vibrio lamellibrachiae]|uniref:vWA domain-containing protein n=1 Tax=Vibrio lamellibrachiae TaxID=2910253 RepID=UPI003D0E4293
MSVILNEISDVISILSKYLGAFHFIRPWWLLMLIPCLGLAWIVKQETKQQSRWKHKLSPTVLKHLTLESSINRRFSPQSMMVLFFVLSTLVLAGPSWQRQASPFLKDDSAIIVALDLSKSMKTSDLKPSRLHSAKAKAAELIEARGNSNTALIAFAGSAHIAMPLTQDSKMATHFLGALDASSIANPEKNQAAVLEKVERVVAHSTSPTTLVLLTDDTDNESIKRYEAISKMHSLKLIVWSMNDVKMMANEAANKRLTLMAEASKGDVVTYTKSHDDVDQVLELIETNMVLTGDSDMPWQDSGYNLLIVLALLHLLWFRKGWTIRWE